MRDGLADLLNARAVTVAQQIHLSKHESIDSDGGRLLGHEIAHVFQQRNAPVSGTATVLDSPVAERAADAISERISRGIAGPMPAALSIHGPVAQRQSKPDAAPVAKKPLPRGGNILYIGLNAFADELPLLKAQYSDVNLEVTSVTATAVEKKFAVGKQRFDLTSDAGVVDFVKTLGLDASKSKVVADAILLHASGERDEISHVVQIYARTEADGRDRMSRVVLSGHIEGASIHSQTYGNDPKPEARVKFEALVSLQTVFPKAAGQVKHLMVAACFGGAESKVTEFYIKAFPNVKTIEGWTTLCPSPTSTAIGAWAARTDSDPSAAPKPSKGRATWSGGVYQGDMPLPAAETMANLRADEPTFLEYVSGARADPSAGVGWLARYYERLHNAQDRPAEIVGADRDYVDLHVNQAFRLRHWKAMASQFWKKFKSIIQRGYGSATSPEYGVLSRKAALDALAKFDVDAKGPKDEKDQAAEKLKGLRDLDPAILDGGWTAP